MASESAGGAVRVESPGENLELPELKDVRVLIVDDEVDGRVLKARILEERGAHPPSRPIPAVAITAYARAEDRQRSLLAGFHMHLSKPVEARELIASIAGLLRLTR